LSIVLLAAALAQTLYSFSDQSASVFLSFIQDFLLALCCLRTALQNANVYFPLLSTPSKNYEKCVLGKILSADHESDFLCIASFT
jgi:hypothetical protein